MQSTACTNNKTIVNRILECLSPGRGQLLSQLFSYLLLVGAMMFSTSSYGGMFITTTFAPDDRLWRVLAEKRYVSVDYSTDLGKTFSTPVRVNSEPQRIKANGENRPGIAVDRSGKIYVTFAAESTQPVAQYFSVSTNNGRSFSTPVPLSDKAAEANSFQGRLALSPSGKVYIFWLDERDRADWRRPGNSIYFTTIDGQGGVDFANQKLAGNLCECCRIAAAFDSEGLPVLFARFIYPGDIRDHGLLRIRTDGQAPLSLRATFDQWKIKGCPEHGPAISISSDDRYHLAWFTQGSIRQGLFYAYSSDRGQHFSTPLPFGTAEKMPSHPDIMAQGKNVILTWTEFDGDKTYLLVMQSSDGGQTWLPPKSIAESKSGMDFPFLLASTQGIFVSWNSKKEGYRLIKVASAVVLPETK